MQAIQKQVGARIRELREKKGISQEALAAICDLHRTYVGLIERGERNLSLSTIEAIAQGLEVPVSEIFRQVELAASRRPAKAKRVHDVTSPPIEVLVAHVATIRQILIDAKLTDAKRYDASHMAIMAKQKKA
jgi:transcriptional regulator with XRE-family HTH domain